jgi:hypothetical protein
MKRKPSKPKRYIVSVYNLYEVSVPANSKREALRLVSNRPQAGELVDRWVCPSVRIA